MRSERIQMKSDILIFGLKTKTTWNPLGNINIKIKIKRLWIGFIFITECVTAYMHTKQNWCCCRRWCFDFSWFSQSMQFILPYVSHCFASLTLNLIFYPSPLRSHYAFQYCVSIDMNWWRCWGGSAMCLFWL